MSDYLSNLVARQLGLAEAVRPRLAGRFEPPVGVRVPGAADAAATEGKPESYESAVEVERQPRAARGGAERESTPREETARFASEEPARFASPARRSSPSAEPVIDSPRTEASYTHPATHHAPPESTPPQTQPRVTTPANVSPVANDERPAVRAEAESSQPPVVKAVERRSPSADEDESGTTPRRRLVAPEPAAAEPSPKRDSATRDARQGTLEKSRPSSADPLTPTVKSSAASRPHDEAAASRTHDDRRAHAPPQRAAPRAAEAEPSVYLGEANAVPQRAALQAGEAEPPRRAATPPHEKSAASERAPSYVEPLVAAEALGRAAEPAPARGDGEFAPARGDGRASVLTVEPLVSRHVPPRRDEYGAPRPTAEAAPTINVTIGRVEVRATQAPPAATRRRGDAPQRVSLDEYLRQRAGGGAG